MFMLILGNFIGNFFGFALRFAAVEILLMHNKITTNKSHSNLKYFIEKLAIK